jgi:hypothetical protein
MSLLRRGGEGHQRPSDSAHARHANLISFRKEAYEIVSTNLHDYDGTYSHVHK